MKRFIIPLLIFFSQTAVFAQNPADKIVGEWLNEEKTSKIEISKTGNSYSGKIVWLAHPYGSDGKPLTDIKNPDPHKRTQSILGLTIVTGLKYSSGEWMGGTIYAPKKGQYADCSVTVSDSNKLKIKVSKGILSKTIIWTKQ